MKTHKFNEERHADLWEERSKQVGRWVFGSLLFGVLALLKVVGPFGQHAAALQSLGGDLESVQARLASTRAETTNNAVALAGVSNVLETVKRAPWKQEMDGLKSRYRELGEQYRLLSSRDPAELRGLVPESAPDVPAATNVFRPGRGAPRRLEAPDRVRVETLQVDPSVIARARPTLPDARVEAATTFRLDPELLSTVQTRDQFRAVLRTNALEVFRDEALGVRETMHATAEASVIQPMEAMIATLPESSAARTNLARAVSETRALIEVQPSNGTSDDDWWQTIEGKDSVTAQLQQQLDRRQRDLQKVLANGQQTLREGQEALAAEAAKLQEDVARQQAELQRTESEMQNLLPDWLRGLFGISVLLQLYPLILLILAGVVFWIARSTRDHFRRVRAAKELDAGALADPAASTVWTLTWRGRMGTRVTQVAYAGFFLLLAALQIAGVGALGKGLAHLEAGDRLLPAGVVLALAWIGAAASVLAAAAILRLLRREVAAVHAATPAQ